MQSHHVKRHSAFGVASRTLAYCLGAGIVALAVAMMATSLTAPTILAWMRETLGISFLVLISALIATSVVCWIKLLGRGPHQETVLEAGLSAASGIATLALTFTLLGISLGIGSLASQELTPQTVQAVIRDLTAEFSLAFLTSVIGLPISTLLRAMLLVTHAWGRSDAITANQETL